MAARWVRLQSKIQGFLPCFRRKLHDKRAPSVEQLRHRYAERKYAINNESLNGVLVDEQGIFPNNELSLHYIDVFGFDYDYTLAPYSNALHDLIYDLAVDVLVNSYGYPKGVKDMKYNPDFAVRGLHYDTSNGLLLKVDAFHNVMLGSVYRGLQPVPNEEVFRIYEGTHLAITKLNPSNFINGPRRTMHHMIDLFSYPEMCLLSNVSEYFMQKEIPYDPEYLFRDCGQAVQNVHKTGTMHQEVMNDIGKYLEKSPDVGQLLNRLVVSGKKLFLITNSNFKFVNKGMNHIIGEDWRDLFEVVVTQARKPEFYRQPASRPFRLVDTDLCSPMWKKVSELKKGEVYMEGNIEQFTHFTNFSGPSVLYFGDHVYSDLRDPVLHIGWRTGAIIPELEREIQIGNSEEYKRCIKWLLALQDLIVELQSHHFSEHHELLDQWKQEKRDLRRKSKEMFNPRFGSVFRTYQNPTYFTRRLVRFADVYMSSLEDMLKFPSNHTFYPRRSPLPHESVLDMR